MLTTLKNFAHKLFGLYLIGGLTTLALVGDVFAQNPAPSNGVPFFDPSKTENVNVGKAGTDQGDGIIGVIKNFINYALGLLGLIALIMLLWGGYKMVASSGDENAYKEGLKILKNAAIGLAFIAVSWFLVTFIFYIIGIVTNP